MSELLTQMASGAGLVAILACSAAGQAFKGATGSVTAEVGRFEASVPLVSPEPGTRALGDTFDSELIIADSPAMTETDDLSTAPMGQSVPGDGSFHLAGLSQLTGFDIEARATQTDNLDGTFTITLSTRVPQFSDGFLPLGLTFAGSGTPIDTLAWAVGTDADRDAMPDALDPLLDSAFPPDGDFTVVGADVFLLDNGVQIGSASLGALPALDQESIEFLIVIAGAAGSGLDEIRVQYLVQDANAPTAMVLSTPDLCLDAGENTLLVDIDATGLTDLCVGGQFFLEFDTTVLDLVSIEPGDAPFLREVYESVDEPGGTIDYAVGVLDGDPGTLLPTTVARLEFAVTGDFCQMPGVVAFRAHSPPSRLTNALGQDLGAIEISLGPVTKDSNPPSITLPPDIVVNADAGECTARLDFVEPFDLSPTLCATETPGCWYTDRYPPAIFASEVFDGAPRLRHGISASDSAANRPPAFSGAFYDTQGRKYNVDIPVGEAWSAQVHIDAGWATEARLAGLWATTFDGPGNISGYPIISFSSNDPSDPLNPTPSMPEPRFRVFSQDTDQDTSNGLTPGWIELGLPVGFSFDRWWTMECRLTPSAYEFRVYDDSGTQVLAFDDTVTFGSIRAGNLILQGFNFGSTYDLYWDNVTLGPPGPVVTDDCSDVTLTLERSDNPALTRSDPFPAGTTTITWTATDACGNSATAEQTVTVDPLNTIVAQVQLAGVDVPSSAMRCVTFEAYPVGGGAPVVLSADVLFIDGLGEAELEVPCGAYSCFAAQDPSHTLRSVDTDDFQVVGAVFVSDLTAAGISDDDALRGGDLVDDGVIDILDFGSFVAAYGATPGSDSPCPPGVPHADVSANGQVDAADFTFIQIGFASADEAPCAAPLTAPPGTRASHASTPVPVRSITVGALLDRGLGRLAAGDLNRDGVLDEHDIVAFLAGAVPAFLADLDHDGVVTPNDVVLLVDRMRAGHADADVNRDGAIDYSDLITVIHHLGAEAPTDPEDPR
ncbi:MAG: hypothetical protein ACIARR_07145 [Phycisphaerales bacterium JB059]